MVAQGDILFIDFEPVKGHEQGGFRPALVISNANFNKLAGGLIIALPITSKIYSHPLRININGKKIKGQILTHHLRTIDLKARKHRFVERIDSTTLKYIKALVKAEIN